MTCRTSAVHAMLCGSALELAIDWCTGRADACALCRLRVVCNPWLHPAPSSVWFHLPGASGELIAKAVGSSWCDSASSDRAPQDRLCSGNAFSPAPVVGMRLGGRRDFTFGICEYHRRLPVHVCRPCCSLLAHTLGSFQTDAAACLRSCQRQVSPQAAQGEVGRTQSRRGGHDLPLVMGTDSSCCTVHARFTLAGSPGSCC